MSISQKQISAAKELARRQSEALRLFRALPHQSPFFACQSRETLSRGGNRSGKSTVCATRFAAIATDRPVIDHNGKEIDCRLPWQKGRQLTMWAIGYGESHIGQTLFRLLFRPGLFKMIRDKKTGLWRTYIPWKKEDADRSMEAKPAPPLIPNRYIKPNSWSWNNKGARVFTKVEIWNPETKEDLAEIYAFTSSGEVKAGDPVDEIWIDEAIKYPSHYAEWQARLIDRRGRITWSSWPRISNSALMDLTKRAIKCKEEKSDLVKEFVFTMSGNPHLDKDSKQEALEGWDENERRARDRGEYITDNLLVYPMYSKHVHTAISEVEDEAEDEVSKILRERHGEPPTDWTRELILDPGTSRPAVLFCAIPPEELGDYRVIYDEIYVPRADADKLAQMIKSRQEHYQFERFIIDSHAGRQKPMGFGVTIQANYSRAFEERELRSNKTGYGFTPGSDDVLGRIMALQEWMRIRGDGTTKLRIVNHRCPNLVEQISSYFKAMDGEVVGEKPLKGQKDDLVVSLEYWASRNPIYVAPTLATPKKSGMERLYSQLIKKHPKQESDTVHMGAGAIGA